MRATQELDKGVAIKIFAVNLCDLNAGLVLLPYHNVSTRTS
jgi:hypothetical protein